MDEASIAVSCDYAGLRSVSGSLIGSVKRTHDTIDLIAFGSGGSILCVSTDGFSEQVPDQGQHNHHESECCVLCAVDYGRGNVDVTLLPYTAAYTGIQRRQPSAIVSYFPPDIALSDGVFPFDVPARAPPFLVA